MPDSMTVPEARQIALSPSRGRAVAYWLPTLYVVVTSAVAGALDLARTQPFFGLLQHLGYPPHFSTLLGTWKELGALALLVPRRPLLKEWAYAGLFIDFSSAVVAHAAAGDGARWLSGPLLALVALVVSWLLRPATRRLPGTDVLARG